MTCVSLQRARTDEATAIGSRSETEDEDDEDYVPYVPLRQRRQLLVRARDRGRNEGGGRGFSVGWRVTPGLQVEASVHGSVASRHTRAWRPDLKGRAARPLVRRTLFQKPGS